MTPVGQMAAEGSGVQGKAQLHRNLRLTWAVGDTVKRHKVQYREWQGGTLGKEIHAAKSYDLSSIFGTVW